MKPSFKITVPNNQKTPSLMDKNETFFIEGNDGGRYEFGKMPFDAYLKRDENNYMRFHLVYRTMRPVPKPIKTKEPF